MWSDVTDSYHPDACAQTYCMMFTLSKYLHGTRYMCAREEHPTPQRHIRHDASQTGIVPAYTSRRVTDGDRTGIYVTTRLAGDYLSATICLFRHTHHNAIICLQRFFFCPQDKRPKGGIIHITTNRRRRVEDTKTQSRCDVYAGL